MKHSSTTKSSEHFQEDRLTGTVDRLRRLSYLDKRGVDPKQPCQLDLLFPHLYDNKRFIPNDYARSSLFTARNKKEPRRTFLHEKLFHLHDGKGVSILYSGTELRAEDDEIVWLQIMHYAKKVPLGEPFEFSMKDLVSELNWSKNGRYYDKVRECLTRLKASEVMVFNQNAYGKSGAISLINKYTCLNDADGKPLRYRMWIDPSMIILFAGNTFTNHLWESYRDLSPIARRLADYINSHKHPHPLNSLRFREMCSTSNKRNRDWYTSIRKACLEIEKKGIARRAWLHDGQIYIERE
jgi:hypothetical protein